MRKLKCYTKLKTPSDKKSIIQPQLQQSTLQKTVLESWSTKYTVNVAEYIIG